MRDQAGRQEEEDLDRCNGIKSPTPEFPDGIYHYVMLKVKTEQSSIRCLKGEVPDALERTLEGRRFLCPLKAHAKRAGGGQRG